MKTFSEKMVEISHYLQILAKPKFSEDVKIAVENNDKKALIAVCKKAKIPAAYYSTISSIILSISPMKWPAAY